MPTDERVQTLSPNETWKLSFMVISWGTPCRCSQLVSPTARWMYDVRNACKEQKIKTKIRNSEGVNVILIQPMYNLIHSFHILCRRNPVGRSLSIACSACVFEIHL